MNISCFGEVVGWPDLLLQFTECTLKIKYFTEHLNSRRDSLNSNANTYLYPTESIELTKLKFTYIGRYYIGEAY